ncbi:MAG: hypothetical protein J1E34_06795 [Oscillospiraceae bacterium]|nr:hypothetical protein [Oscillospiraceae bacterium]
MKKVLAVFMAVLMAFSALSVAVYAQDGDTSEETTTAVRYPQEEPSTGIVDDDGLVVPQNPTQLGMAFFFKIIEKVINFILGLFGGGNLDGSISGSVDDAGKWLDEAISNIFGSLDN